MSLVRLLGFTTLESVTHAAETMLALLRDGTATYDAEIAGVLMRTTDSVREMLGIIEQTHAEGTDDYAGVLQPRLNLRLLRLIGIVERSDP